MGSLAIQAVFSEPLTLSQREEALNAYFEDVDNFGMYEALNRLYRRIDEIQKEAQDVRDI
jgi:hypothetical protein